MSDDDGISSHDGPAADWRRHRALGLVGNPFRLADATEAWEVGVKLTTRAAGLRMLSAIEEALAGERPRPVRVLKSSSLPAYYPRGAMTTVLRELGAESGSGLLPVYVQLIMMRKGRVRGTLSALAEMVVARRIDTTIARYTRRALGEPDTALSEWAAVCDLDVASLAERFESDPEATVADVFGAPVDLRVKVDGGLAQVMRESGIRQAGQPLDPVEDDDAAEDDAAEKSAAMASGDEPGDEAPSDETTAPQDPDDEQSSRTAAEWLAVVEYVIAHMRTHASPVLARALRTYVESGTAAMAQELKITRAPRKTIGALVRFASLTFRSVVIIYDGLEAWGEMPVDLRATVLSGLSEVRLALGGQGVMVIAGSDLDAPEIDDQFANAIRVSWDMPELERSQAPDAAADEELLAEWLRAATVPGADTSGLLARVVEACTGAGDLASGAARAADEIEHAAGLTAV
ncbi:MAG TPA: hypothetical protein VFH17_02290 [Coriobacteriia bacterium]|nr:hypothetical protein [Coriobacteriia bacterium]